MTSSKLIQENGSSQKEIYQGRGSGQTVLGLKAWKVKENGKTLSSTSNLRALERGNPATALFKPFL
jgi:hypothetical protein